MVSAPENTPPTCALFGRIRKLYAACPHGSYFFLRWHGAQLISRLLDTADVQILDTHHVELLSANAHDHKSKFHAGFRFLSARHPPAAQYERVQ